MARLPEETGTLGRALYHSAAAAVSEARPLLLPEAFVLLHRAELPLLGGNDGSLDGAAEVFSATAGACDDAGAVAGFGAATKPTMPRLPNVPVHPSASPIALSGDGVTFYVDRRRRPSVDECADVAGRMSDGRASGDEGVRQEEGRFAQTDASFAAAADATAAVGGRVVGPIRRTKVSFQSASNSEIWWSDERDEQGRQLGIAARPMGLSPQSPKTSPRAFHDDAAGGDDAANATASVAGRAQPEPKHGYAGRWFCLVQRNVTVGPEGESATSDPVVPPPVTTAAGKQGSSFVMLDSALSLVQTWSDLKWNQSCGDGTNSSRKRRTISISDAGSSGVCVVSSNTPGTGSGTGTSGTGTCGGPMNDLASHENLPERRQKQRKLEEPSEEPSEKPSEEPVTDAAPIEPARKRHRSPSPFRLETDHTSDGRLIVTLSQGGSNRNVEDDDINEDHDDNSDDERPGRDVKDHDNDGDRDDNPGGERAEDKSLDCADDLPARTVLQSNQTFEMPSSPAKRRALKSCKARHVAKKKDSVPLQCSNCPIDVGTLLKCHADCGIYSHSRCVGLEEEFEGPWLCSTCKLSGFSCDLDLNLAEDQTREQEEARARELNFSVSTASAASTFAAEVASDTTTATTSGIMQWHSPTEIRGQSNCKTCGSPKGRAVVRVGGESGAEVLETFCCQVDAERKLDLTSGSISRRMKVNKGQEAIVNGGNNGGSKGAETLRFRFKDPPHLGSVVEICSEGAVIGTYASTIEAANVLGYTWSSVELNIRRVCNGERPDMIGHVFRWRVQQAIGADEDRGGDSANREDGDGKDDSDNVSIGSGDRHAPCVAYEALRPSKRSGKDFWAAVKEASTTVTQSSSLVRNCDDNRASQSPTQQPPKQKDRLRHVLCLGMSYPTLKGVAPPPAGEESEQCHSVRTLRAVLNAVRKRRLTQV